MGNPEGKRALEIHTQRHCEHTCSSINTCKFLIGRKSLSYSRRVLPREVNELIMRSVIHKNCHPDLSIILYDIFTASNVVSGSNDVKELPLVTRRFGN